MTVGRPLQTGMKGTEGDEVGSVCLGVQREWDDLGV
jgi:hypothetical protein